MFLSRRYSLISGLMVMIALLMVATGALIAQDQMDDELQGEVPGFDSWEEVLAAAEGTTVTWWMWGGDDQINTNVDTDIGERVQELYGVTLNRVPNGAELFVDQVLNEASAGVEQGTIDLMWINGENFRTLKEADLLYGPWAESIPNARYVNWDDPALAYDFGYAVDGYESPWGHAQFVMEYNTDLVGDTPPTTFEDLTTWIEENPGLFTYPALPDFTGSVFVRHVFYWVAGGPEPFLGEFDQDVFDEYAPAVWDYLNEIEPHLWRGGETYPEATVMDSMLANQEIAFNMGYGPANAANNILQGIYPESIRTFVFDTGTISNNNFVAIPFNATNPAGAMVIANYMLSEEFQLKMVDPELWAWQSPISPTVYSDEFQEAVDNMELHPAMLPSTVLAAAALPEPNGDWVTAIEAGWIENVLEN
ncbi:MAG: ABC transporter substrate-binding protein [Anaerolineaceae bacterium]|nr:ABC transporter substrate-binding protein [Anaerolineaceae bacterium]